MVQRISTGSPFEATIGYSRAVVDGDTVYVSGTTGYDYKTMTMPDDVGEQAAQRARDHRPGARGSRLARSRTRCASSTTSPTWRTMMRLVAVAGTMFGDIRPAATMLVCG